MAGLAIIANPNAHRNRNWPLASQALRKAAPGAVLFETRTERELREAAAQVARDKPRVVAIVANAPARTATVGTPLELPLWATDDMKYTSGTGAPPSGNRPAVSVRWSKYRGPGDVSFDKARPENQPDAE